MQSKEKLITFIVTQDCQLRCKYCYLVAKNSKEKMNLAIAKKAVDYILYNEELFPEKSVIFDFIGGEPLLEIDLISDITEYIIQKITELSHHWQYNYSFKITTNGLLYNSQKVQKFIEKYKEKLNISISIDGTKEKNDVNRVFPNGAGSYDKIIPCIKTWIKQFPNSTTRMVISHDDLPYIKDSFMHLIKLGIKNFDMNIVVEDVWQEGDDNTLEKQLISLADYIVDNDLFLHQDFIIFNDFIGRPLSEVESVHPCGNIMLAIDARGNFYSCHRFAKYSLRNKSERTIGNVYNGINLNRLRPIYTIDEYTESDNKCVNCEVASGCRWCIAENYDTSNTFTIFQRSIAICKMHKARVRAKNYYWSRLYNKVEKENKNN
jgi:uncharacterized protein